MGSIRKAYESVPGPAPARGCGLCRFLETLTDPEDVEYARRTIWERRPGREQWFNLSGEDAAAVLRVAGYALSGKTVEVHRRYLHGLQS